MIKKIIFSVSLLVLVSSCSHQQPSDNYYNNFSDYQCVDPNYIRKPSSAARCEQLFDINAILKSDTDYVNKLKSNPELAIEVSVAENNLELRSPVPVSTRINNFRKRFIAFIKNPVLREPIVRSFESSLRMRSKVLENEIRNNESYAQYDMVIVGAGVHGVLALNEALSKNPNLKILVVDDSDTAGATFRYAKEAFSINSSNRASGKDSKPLPGEGNINELPGLPIQLSDLTNVKYPSANDLGVAINTGLYAAVREYPNVDVLFNSSVKKLLAKSKDRKFDESVELATSDFPEDTIQIDAQRVLITTGLGTPSLPTGLAEAIALNPKLTKSIKGKVPRVVTFEDIMRAIGSSNNPTNLFKDKKIAVVGKGDSANVFIEFLLGYAPREGYAQSTSQNGRPSKILWVGQENRTCSEFISDIRSRYQQISTGFRSSSDKIEAILEAVPPKLQTVKSIRDDKVEVVLERNSEFRYRGNEKLDVDMIIVTTGFNQNLRGLLAEITQGNSTSFKSDEEYFGSKSVVTLKAPTSISKNETRVARKVKDRQIYILGTAAGKLAADNELVGIIQNFVSIFNNAPRVLSAVDIAISGLSNKTKAEKIEKEKTYNLPVQRSFRITNIQETRLMPTQTQSFLVSTFNEALSYIKGTSGGKIELEIKLTADGDLLINSTSTTTDIGVVQLLTETREFYSIAATVLRGSPGKSILLQASSVGVAFNPETSRVSLIESTKDFYQTTSIFANRVIRLRGLEPNARFTKENVEANILGRQLIRELDYGQQSASINRLLRNPKTNLNLIDPESGEPILFKLTSAEQLKLALENPNLDVNLKSEVGFSYLFEVVRDVDLEKFELLLKDPRTDFKIKNEVGDTPKTFYQKFIRPRTEGTDLGQKFKAFVKAQLGW